MFGVVVFFVEIVKGVRLGYFDNYTYHVAVFVSDWDRLKKLANPLECFSA